MGPEERRKKKKNQQNLATIVQFGKPLIYETWGSFHGAALKDSGMCRVKKKKLSSADGYSCARSLPNADTHTHCSLPRFHLAAGPQSHLFQLASQARPPGADTKGDAGTEMLVSDRALGKVSVLASISPFLEGQRGCCSPVLPSCCPPIACSQLTP